jgi:hypothetical protein
MVATVEMLSVSSIYSMTFIIDSYHEGHAASMGEQILQNIPK